MSTITRCIRGVGGYQGNVGKKARREVMGRGGEEKRDPQGGQAVFEETD